MNQKKIFNLKQYWEVVKQLKVVGIVATAIFILIAILKPVSDTLSLIADMGNSANGAVSSLQIVDYVSEYKYLVIAFIIVAPILTLVCWNFMTKRASSDFYHSLPYTRLCTYLDHMLAVITWELVMLLGGALSSTITYTIVRRYVVVDYSILWRMYLTIFLCTLLCSVAVSIACMITGTLFSNICVSGLIIFLPRLLMYTLTSVMASGVPFLVQEHFAPWLNNEYNLLTGICFSFFNRGFYGSLALSVPGMIYTAILSALYLCLAGFLYVHRKSETAGKGAASGKLQFLIRTLIGFTICSFGIATVIDNIYGYSYRSGRMVMTLVIIAIVAALFVSVYECINMKSIRGVIKSVMSIITSYVAAVVVTIALILIMNAMMGYRPNASKITGVSFYNSNSSYSRVNDYFKTCSQDTVLEQKDIINILSSAYADNVKVYESDKNNFHRYVGRSNLVEYTVNFKDGWGSTYRNVYLTKDQVDQIADYLKQSDSYKKAFLDFPDAEKASITWIDNTNFSISDQDGKKVYEQLVSEAKSITFDEWYKNLYEGENDLSVEIEFSRSGKVYRMYIPISKVLPQTKQMYYQFMSEDAQEKKAMQECREVINSYLEGTHYPVANNINMVFVDPNSTTVNRLHLEQFMTKATVNGSQTLKSIEEQMQKGTQKIDLTKPYVIVSYHTYGSKDYDEDGVVNYNEDDYETFSIPIQLPGYETMSDYYK